MTRTAPRKIRTTSPAARISKVRLAEMIEEATVDAYGETEQATGWFTMFEEYLQLPFDTTVLGTAVSVTSVDLRDGGHIVAVCTRGRDRQAIPLADLPLPSPRPGGSEWIDAYRHWLAGR